MNILAFDIGGTKCAVITARWDDESITLLKKEKCPTDLSISPKEMIEKLMEIADICICAPEMETYKIQELHLPIYHYLCATVEAHFFDF